MEIRKSENHRALPTASNFSLFFVIFVELFRRNFLVLRALLVSVQRKMFTTEHFRFTKHGRLFAKAHCTCSMHRGALAVYPGLSDCAALSPRSLVEVIRNFTRVLITFDNYFPREKYGKMWNGFNYGWERLERTWIFSQRRRYRFDIETA